MKMLALHALLSIEKPACLACLLEMRTEDLRPMKIGRGSLKYSRSINVLIVERRFFTSSL